MERTYASVITQDWAASDDEDYGELPIAATRISEEEVSEESEETAKLREALADEDDERSRYIEIAREVLGLSESEWGKYIAPPSGGKLDFENGLVLINYKEDDMDKNPLPLKVQELRGVVVDVRAGARVCAGSEYTERITLRSLDLIDDPSDESKKAIRVHSNTLNRDVIFPIETDDTTRASYYSQGLNLKVFLHNGKLRVINNKHLDPSGKLRGRRPSAYNYNEPFTQSFHRLLPEAKLRALFPKKCLYSPYSYNFLLSMPWAATATRLDVPKDGYITFIRKDKLWDVDSPGCAFLSDKTKADGKNTFWVGETPDLDGKSAEEMKELFTGKKLVYNADAGLPRTDRSSFNYRKRILNTEQVRQLLFTDREPVHDRSFYGEAVILTKRQTLDDGRVIFYSVRLQPPAYEWREKFFEEKVTRSGLKGTDVYETYLDLLTQNGPPTIALLESRFPIYGGTGDWDLPAAIRSLESGKRFFAVGESINYKRADTTKMTFPNEKDWESVVSLYFIFLISPCRQPQALACYRRYRKEREITADFLSRNYFNPKDRSGVEKAKPRYTVVGVHKGEKKSYVDLFQFAMRCFSFADYKASASIAAREENARIIFRLLNRNPGIERKAILQQAIILSDNDTAAAWKYGSMIKMTSLYPEGVESMDVELLSKKLKNIKENKKKAEGEYKRAKEENKVNRPQRNRNFRAAGNGK